MKSRNTTVFVCQNCGSQSPKWTGQCRECQGWNTYVEENSQTLKKLNEAQLQGEMLAGSHEAVDLFSESPDSSLNKERIPTGFSEVNRVLGGGIVSGSLNLFGGEPGIGKSTLLLQIAGNLGSIGKRVLYVSGEESLSQVSSRAKRLGLKSDLNFKFLSTTDLELALDSVQKNQPHFVVVDSVQTLSTKVVESSPGTISQIRAVTLEFMKIAKVKGITVFLVGHVTKEGTVAGPKLLEHMVDGVFYFESSSNSGFRMLRGQKNRFGSTNEVAVFEMTPMGLSQVDNPSERFLAERSSDMPGSSVIAQLEGTRPIMTEFQSLCQKCYVGYPKRTVQGIDGNRVSVLLAVVEKVLGQSFSDQEVYCKVASGHRVSEPASDLAVLMSLVSALEYRPLPRDILYLGEVGLGGELRSFSGVQSRLNEAKSVGISKVILPKWLEKEAAEVKGIEVLPASTVRDAYRLSFLGPPASRKKEEQENSVPAYRPARPSEFDSHVEDDLQF
jgi:DNA repair protein RadA/Sms